MKRMPILKFPHILGVWQLVVIWQKEKDSKDLTLRATRIKEALAVMQGSQYIESSTS